MFTVETYQAADGSSPVADWLASLTDQPTVARILARLERVGHGNFGDHKALGDGLSELRLNFGPGYRLYYAQVGAVVVLLLCGGDKASQKRDIKRAAALLADYKERTK